ncbi:L-proline dehydrogenase [Chitinophaga costaii]|uniref:L-proline dehydrogenase n=1 Tax=Chitinophaga costaii TaxID=1335309 RepID=A0A1C4FWA1_9BACT|nr:proline dehydrogenase family protein [Chitinophaga costaii]PUZ27280.1 proline dehydrogenase [Chitinophaga costaii]SCC60269.1 L-proline dehydrogenase [Chitinophaga costaii]
MEQQFDLSFENTGIAFEAKTNQQLKKANFLFSAMGRPWLVKVGAAAMPLALKIGLPIKGLIKSTIFSQFCGGENMPEAAAASEVLGKYNVGVVLDYGVEAMEGEHNYDHAVEEFTRAIRFAAGKPYIPFIAIKVTGFARFSLLEKVASGKPLSSAEQDEYDRVHLRIKTICEAAAKNNIRVLIDAEESWIQPPVDELAEAMMALFNQGTPVVYNTYQLYLHSRLAALKTAEENAREKGYLLGAKLVRGAYMEKERKRALEMGYPSPVQPNKAATDNDYNAAVQFCIERLDSLAVFIGTHNENSCMLAARLLQEKGIPPQHPHVNFSQLLGMSDNITFNLAHSGYHVSKYLPYGPVKDVMPYLLRRAQENTSIAGQTGRELGLIRKEIKRRASER